jgi:SAM-dependent methyltransferase
VFGFRAAQAGLPDVDFLRANRIPFRFTLALDAGAALTADPLQLPLASQSLDLLALPHGLELTADPRHVLREAERVLMPEGQIIISGFNPLSTWGLRHSLTREQSRRATGAPWDSRFIGLLRLKDWLHLLGFELNGGGSAAMRRRSAAANGSRASASWSSPARAGGRSSAAFMSCARSSGSRGCA